MKWAFILIWLTFGIEIFAQQKTSYVGTLGDTVKVEMEISTSNEKDYTGRYRYQGKKEWILLKGAMYYDKRNKIAQNLVLYEFAQSQDTSFFDLYMEGNSLTGTWQKNKQSPISAVNLSIGEPDRSSAFDGSYISAENSVIVKTISDNSIEVDINIAEAAGCSGLKLKGRLQKLGNEWKGSLADEEDRGEATVVVSFADDKANMEIIPGSSSMAKCGAHNAAYIRQTVNVKEENKP